jgi:hypothetical protein
MTLRDYFAGQALAGLIPQYVQGGHPGQWAVMVSAAAYEFADAMLAEREKRSSRHVSDLG